MPLIRLPWGNYLSPVGARREMRVASLVETVYSPGMKLPRHSHEAPYLVLMLAGVLREKERGRTHDMACGSVVFNEAGEEHENELLTPRGRCLNIELRPAFMQRMLDSGLRPRESVMYAHIGPAMSAAGRLYVSMIDPGPELEVEEALFQIFETLSRCTAGRSAKWVGKVAELIRQRFPERPTLSELAAHAGVQEVHLCRGFRRAMGCTIGEYLRKMRAERAMEMVVQGHPLAAAAQGAGFADQSHMTRVFAQEFGRSPGRVGQAARTVRSRP